MKMVSLIKKDDARSLTIVVVSSFCTFLIGIFLGCVLFSSGEVRTNFQIEEPHVRSKRQAVENTTPNRNANVFNHGPTSPTCKVCRKDNPILSRKRNKPVGLFDPLSGKEMARVTQFMKSRKLIVDKSPLKLTDDYIANIVPFPPNKKDALRHLDNGGPHPGRFAQVFVNRGSRKTPDVMVYKVGPLDGAMTAKKLYADGEIPFNARSFDEIEYLQVLSIVFGEFKKLDELFRESFDDSVLGLGLSMYFYAPNGLKENDRETYVGLGFTVLGANFGNLINPLPFGVIISHPGTDRKKYKMYNFFYANQGPFDTAEDLLDAFKKNKIRKVIIKKGHKKTILEKSFPKEKVKRRRRFSKRPCPRTYEPRGPRYRIRDYTVKYMNWEFTIGMNERRGISVHNVLFNEERIAYDIRLSEIALLYGSNTMGVGGSVYTDSSFGIGYPGGIIKDVDCPVHATILETNNWITSSQSSFKSRTICIFEEDGQRALWRHRDNYRAGLRDSHLVVRFPTTLGNYDYTIDFAFYLDGRIHTTTTASGILQAGFWDEGEPLNGKDKSKDPFGYRVSQLATGAIHDHTFAFRVDLDIVGRDNTFQFIHWKAGDVTKALNTQATIKKIPPHFRFNQTRYVQWETLDTEKGFKIDYERPKFWTIINENRKNKWGAKRGYRIVPMATGSEVMPSSHLSSKALSFTKYHCAITRYKSNEQEVTGYFDLNRLSSPAEYFDLMLNKECIKNHDLVAWIMVSFLHIPTSEDYPMTNRVMTGFWLKPFNFFDSTPSLDLPHYNIYINGDIREQPEIAEPCFENVNRQCIQC